MLKWAVNGTVRQSYLRSADEDNNTLTPPTSKSKSNSQTTGTTATSRAFKRKSFLSHENERRKSASHTEKTQHIRRKILRRDKENNLTSTPLPLSALRSTVSPFRKLHSLKDLSNITLSSVASSPFSTPKNDQSSIASEMQCFTTTTPRNNYPSQYATTLPTFDVEYSPCNNTVPGPILALRGIGIADSYFEKPRYLTDQITLKNSDTISENSKSNSSTKVEKSLRRSSRRSSFMSQNSTIQENRDNNCKATNTVTFQNDESLSSSRMGDMTLDKMIDAILESARKERRLPKFRNTSNHPIIMSPTYTPAEDPASDLNETWDSKSEKYLPKEDNCDRKRRRFSIETDIANRKLYNEREVKTPEDWCQNSLESSQKQNSAELMSSCHLRRQRAVRRKRKLSLASRNFLKSTVKSSAQKLLSSNSNTFRRKSIDELAAMETPKGRNYHNNISPDSGRNSPSDLETMGSPLDDLNLTTKKRLSFSPPSIESKEINQGNSDDKETVT